MMVMVVRRMVVLMIHFLFFQIRTAADWRSIRCSVHFVTTTCPLACSWPLSLLALILVLETERPRLQVNEIRFNSCQDQTLYCIYIFL